jgi:hypothetical protein
MGHVTSPDQGLSSKRGKSLGTRLAKDQQVTEITVHNTPVKHKQKIVVDAYLSARCARKDFLAQLKDMVVVSK